MKKLEPYPIALALFFIFTVFYVVCVGIKLILAGFGVESVWHMYKIWEFLLPGFSGINSLSVITGLLEISVGSYALGYILVPLYNFLLKKKIKEHKVEIKPVLLRFTTLSITFSLYLVTVFTICLLYDLVVPNEYQMTVLWKILLPGFSNLTFESYIIGILVIVIYSVYISFIFSKTLNYFEKSQSKDVKEIISEEHKVRKYDAKYFGVTAGLFFVFAFALAVIKLAISQVDSIPYIKTLIPFFDNITLLNIAGGIAASFLWGWVLGYFFMIFYNWINKKILAS